jgi:hypothetical protein
MSNMNGNSAEWFGKGGRSIPDMEAASAVVASQVQALRFGWTAMMEIGALASGRGQTTAAIFGDGHVEVARSRAVYAAVETAASAYETLIQILEETLAPSITACLPREGEQ